MLIRISSGLSCFLSRLMFSFGDCSTMVFQLGWIWPQEIFRCPLPLACSAARIQKLKIIVFSVAQNWQVFGKRLQVGGASVGFHLTQLVLSVEIRSSLHLQINLIVSLQLLARLWFGPYGVGGIDCCLLSKRNSTNSKMKTYFRLFNARLPFGLVIGKGNGRLIGRFGFPPRLLVFPSSPSRSRWFVGCPLHFWLVSFSC